MSKAIVGVDILGEISWHVAGVASDYTTLCGIDACDPEIGHNGVVDTPKGQKVTCQQCYHMWERLQRMNLREASFDPEAKLFYSE